MIGGNKLSIKYLNPDLCYAVWVMKGSISRSQRFMAEQGFKHPLTGKPPSRMGIHYAAKESEFYAEFLSRRGPKNIGAAPTKAEYHEAQIIVEQLLAAELRRNQELLKQYYVEAPVGA